MRPSRLLFLAVLLLGVAVTATFHASGAVSEADARLATAACDGSLATWPPSPVSSRVLHLGVDLIRLVWAPTGLFRALHLTTGFLLAFAAATSALVAARLGADRGATGLAAAVLVGASMLFGGDVGGLGVTAPVLLVLLAGSVWAWTCRLPRAGLGGLLLGLAAAEHPLVLFLFPGFGGFALQATFRVSPSAATALLRRGALTFLLGFTAVFLPILDARNAGILHVSAPHSPFAALAAWAYTPDGPFWTLGGPSRWLVGITELALALWRNAGPIGVVAALFATRAFFSGATRFARPFLVVHGAIATAIVFGNPKDHGTAAVLAGWSVLFWTIPALARLEQRLAERSGVERAARLAPVVGVAAAALLLAMNLRTIDRAGEKGVTWTRTVLETLPKNAILLTRNPVAIALAAEGMRPDVDVVHVDEPSTWTAFRSGRPLFGLGEESPQGRLDPDALRSLMVANEGSRGVYLDPSVYFDVERRTKLLEGGWIAVPHGLAFRVADVTWQPSTAERVAAALAWDGVNVTPDTPPSPLREGLGGSAYFARSLTQSAYLQLEQGREEDAEREFLIAMGHPAANQNVAALGYAQVLHSRRNWRGVIRTIETRVRDDQDGAWAALRLAGNTYVLLGDSRHAITTLQRALRLTPESMASERAKLQRTIRDLQARSRDDASPPRAG